MKTGQENMTSNISALKDVISAFKGNNPDAWDEAVLQLQGPEAYLISEILERYPHPGPNAASSDALMWLIEQGIKEFADLQSRGEKMFSDRLHRCMHSTMEALTPEPAIAPVPTMPRPAAPAPAADFSPAG